MIGLHISKVYKYEEHIHCSFSANILNYSIVLSHHDIRGVQRQYKKNSIQVILDGWIFNSEDYSTQCKFIHEQYISYGLDFIYNLNGQFNLAILNFKEEKLIVTNDIFGMRKHFTNKNHSNLCYSSDINFLKKNKKTIKVNEETVEKKLAYPRFQNNNTLYENIHFVKRCFLFNSSSKTAKSYSFDRVKLKYNSKIESNKDLITKIRDSTNEVHKTKKVLVALSGGLDSRFVLENCHFVDCEIETINWGTQYSDECTIARSVAKSLDLAFTGVNLNPYDFIENIDTHTKNYGGLDIFVQSAAIKPLQLAKEKHEKGYVYDSGLALDIYFRDSYKNHEYTSPKKYVNTTIDFSEINSLNKNLNQFIEDNRIFTTLALRQSLHREYFDDRYSMFHYDTYFKMHEILSNGVASYKYYYDLLSSILTKTKNIKVQSTMLDLNTPFNYFQKAQSIQKQIENLTEQIYLESKIVSFHNRYYSDFNMWFRSNSHWKKLLNKFDSNQERHIHKYIEKGKVRSIIDKHLLGTESNFSDLLSILTIDIFLENN